MLATGEPQLVTVQDTKTGDAHSLVVYQVKPDGLMVADPNYPGNASRKIEYAAGKFKPYSSAANALAELRGKGTLYDRVCYAPKLGVNDWSRIASRWQEVKNGTIGNDRFPPYKILYMSDRRNYTWAELKDGQAVATPDIVLTAEFTLPARTHRAIPYVWKDGSAFRPEQVVNLTGGEIHGVPLKEGENRLGLWLNIPGEDGPEYVDFKYMTITRNALTIDPPQLAGAPNTDYTFTATIQAPPAGASYQWLVDGKVQRTGASNTFTFRATAAGSYLLAVRLLDKDGENVAEATAPVTIKAGATPTATASPKPPTPPARLDIAETRKIRVSLTVTGTGREVRDGKAQTLTSPFMWSGTLAQGSADLTWSGTSFTARWTHSEYGTTTTQVISGTVSSDGKTVTRLQYSDDEVARGTDYKGQTDTSESFRMELADIPLTAWSGREWGFSGSGAGLSKQVAGLTYSRSESSARGNIEYTLNSYTTDAGSKLTVVFYW